MIYPLHEYTYDNPDQGALIDKSLKHWLSYSEAYRGYSWLAAASMTAMKGNGVVQVDLHKNEWVVLHTGSLPSLDIAQVPVTDNTNYWGTISSTQKQTDGPVR